MTTALPKLSAKRAELIEGMKFYALNPNDLWQLVPAAFGLTIRHSVRGLTTPDWARERKLIPGMGGELTRPRWDASTYSQHVFLTLAHSTAKPLLGVSHAPWAARIDRDLTLTRALEILRDPAVVL